jgi:hypothetical protein
MALFLASFFFLIFWTLHLCFFFLPVQVGQFVVANADYIVDSLCRQLHHLDLNPHVPDILASMLCYIGASRDILPFLEEPMRAVSSELEVLGRHDHPHLTVPFLKAVSEVAKASRHESVSLPDEVESFFMKVRSEGEAIQSLIEKRRDTCAMPGNSLISLIINYNIFYIR